MARGGRTSASPRASASPRSAAPSPAPEPSAPSQDALTKQLAEVANLRDELTRLKESHIRRESRMQHEIAELKVKLQEAIGGRSQPEVMNDIRATHAAIQDRLGDIQDRTVELLTQQKDEMARQFHVKLAEVVNAKDKSDEQEHSAEEWAKRFREAQDHLKRTETNLIDSDRRNTLLETENKRLRSQYRSQENDREFLVRQLVAVKRDNVRLREELQKANGRGGSAGSDSASSLPPRPGTADTYRSVGSYGGSRPGTAGSRPGTAGSRPGTAGRPSTAGTSDVKLRETAARLRKLLDKERAALRQVRAAYATDQQNRTELEQFLAQCIQDVRQEIGRQRQGEAISRHGRPPSAPPSQGRNSLAGSYAEFDEHDRKKVMEMLLSQERVIKLLYEKTFSRGPPVVAAASAAVPEQPPQRAQSADPSARTGAGGAVSRASGAGSSLRLARPSSAPHRQQEIRPLDAVYDRVSLEDVGGGALGTSLRSETAAEKTFTPGSMW